MREDETVLDAARKITGLGAGAADLRQHDRLRGMLTDRDIVIKVLGAGKNLGATPAGELARAEAVTIGADDDTTEILRTMTSHKVRRLPVIDGHRLVADVAKMLPSPQVGELVETLSTD